MNNTFRLLAIMVCLLFAVACGESMESETLGGGADGLAEGERADEEDEDEEVEGDSDGDDSVESADTETDGSEYEPCAGLQCGDSCSVCPPDDLDCVETTVLKYCTDDGQCLPGDDPVCSDDEAEYQPCGGLTCGDTCSLCPPDDPECVETAVVKYCDADGQCSAQAPRCEVEEEPYDPCGGLTCGDSCSVCPPDDDDCFETAVLKFCDADGRCHAGDPVCEDDDAYDPCEGLSCGDSCSLCAPDDDDCYETMELKYCTDDGFCQGTEPVCAAVEL